MPPWLRTFTDIDFHIKNADANATDSLSLRSIFHFSHSPHEIVKSHNDGVRQN